MSRSPLSLAAQNGGIEPGGILAHAGCGVECIIARALRQGGGGTGRCVVDGRGERLRERAGIGGRHKPRMVRPQRLGHAADAGGDHRQAVRHRFQHDKGQPLEGGRQDEQIGIGHERGHVVPGPEEIDRKSVPRGAGADAVLSGAATGQPQPRVRMGAGKPRHRGDQGAVVLLRGEAGHAQDRRRLIGAVRAMRRRPRVDPVRDACHRQARTAHRFQHRPPAVGGGQAHRYHRVERSHHARVIRALPGAGDEPRQMLGPHNGCRGFACQTVAFPADARMDMDDIRARQRMTPASVGDRRRHDAEPAPLGRKRTARLVIGKDDPRAPAVRQRAGERQHVAADAGRVRAVGRHDDGSAPVRGRIGRYRRRHVTPRRSPMRRRGRADGRPACGGSTAPDRPPGPCCSSGTSPAARRRSRRAVPAPAPRSA